MRCDHENLRCTPPARRAFFVVALFIFVMTALNSGQPAAAADQTAIALTSTAIVRDINRARAKVWLPYLHSNPALNKAAEAQTQDMFKRQYFAHRAGKLSFTYFVSQQHLDTKTIGQNLGLNPTSSAGLIRAWLNSITHRRNLYNRQYTDIGVAVIRGQFFGRPTVIAVAYFASLAPATIASVPK